MIKIPVKVENRNGFKYKLCVPFKFESKNYDSYVPGIPNVPNSHVSESPLSGIPTKMSCISGYSGQRGFRAPRNGIATRHLFM